MEKQYVTLKEIKSVLDIINVNADMKDIAMHSFESRARTSYHCVYSEAIDAAVSLDQLEELENNLNMLLTHVKELKKQHQ